MASVSHDLANVNISWLASSPRLALSETSAAK